VQQKRKYNSNKHVEGLLSYEEISKKCGLSIRTLKYKRTLTKIEGKLFGKFLYFTPSEALEISRYNLQGVTYGERKIAIMEMYFKLGSVEAVIRTLGTGRNYTQNAVKEWKKDGTITVKSAKWNSI